MEFIPGRMYKRVGESGYNFCKGFVYKAEGKDRVLRDDGKSVLVLDKTNFKPVEGEPTVVSRDGVDWVMKDDKEDNTYTFNVSSEDAIDHQEIMETLTRKRPVAIVKRSDGMHTVIIHDSLWNKVYHVDQVLKDKLFAAIDAYLPGGYLHLSSKHLGVVLGLLRELRTTPYVNRKKLTVSVETLEI